MDKIKTIRDSIENVQYSNQITKINYRFRFRTININELKDICKNMNN